MYQLEKLGFNFQNGTDDEEQEIPELFTPGEAPRMIEFFILPTYSYFGDYQILYDLRSQIQYRAGDGNLNRLMIALCLKKDKLLEMMDDFPEARKFYMERSWERRTEFRRRMRKFYQKLQEKEIIDKFMNIKQKEEKKSEFQSEHDRESESDIYLAQDEQDQEKSPIPEEEEIAEFSFEHEKVLDPELKEEKLKAREIKKLVQKDISKFYPIDRKDELENDFDSNELEEISDDEKNYGEDDFITDDNRVFSQESAKNIHYQMAQMSEIYSRMSDSMESNLIAVQHYVRTLQNNEN